MRNLRVLTLIIAISLLSICTLNLSAKTDIDIADFSEDEIIIQYKNSFKLNFTATNNGLSNLATQTNEDFPVISSTDDLASSLSNQFGLKLKNSDQDKGHRTLSLNFKKNSKNTNLKLSNTGENNDSILVLELEDANKESVLNAIQEINKQKPHIGSHEVIQAYPNYIYKTDAIPEQVAEPNDEFFRNQWAFRSIHALDGWRLTLGEDIVVAVIDTGLDYNHEDLVENVWINEDEIPNNGKDDDGNGFVDDVRGWDFVKDGGASCIIGEDCKKRDNDPSDHNSHGTHVSGIIAAAQNNNKGISGIAPKAKIMALRAAFSIGQGAILKTTDILDSLKYAVENGANVINMSFSGSGLGVLQPVIKQAHEAGVVMVAAAGNSNSSNLTFPAAFENVISVGSINGNNDRSFFSNFGNWVDIAAPGSAILSTMPDNKYANKSGTSMAAPYVAGVAALVMSRNKFQNMSPDDVKNTLLEFTLPSDFSALDPSTNIGLLNSDIGYQLAVTQMNIPSTSPLGQNINFVGNGSDSQSLITGYEWTSNIDGFLSDQASFSIDSLSEGIHTISFRVINDLGQSSATVSQKIDVGTGKGNGGSTISPNARIKIIKNKKKTKLKAKTRKFRGQIVSYEWISNIDGQLSLDTKVIPLDSLSTGLHLITVKAKDINGEVLKETSRTVRVK